MKLKFNVIIFLALALITFIFLFYNDYGLDKEETNKIKIKVKGAKRNLKGFDEVNEINLEQECYKLIFYSNKVLALATDESERLAYYVIEGNKITSLVNNDQFEGKILGLYPQKDFIYASVTQQDGVFLTANQKRLISLYKIKNNEISKVNEKTFDALTTIIFTDSNSYYIKTTNKLTYLFKESIFRENDFDSLNLNEFYNSNEEHLDFVLQGNFFINFNLIGFMPTFFSNGFYFDKRNLSIYKEINSIDSLKIPKFYLDTKANFSLYKLEPEIYSNLQQSQMQDKIVNLSLIDLKKREANDKTKSSYLDCYDTTFKYVHSYEIKDVDSNFPISFTIDEKNQLFYVLFSDYRTIKIYKYES